jgi:hypothetical protein
VSGYDPLVALRARNRALTLRIEHLEEHRQKLERMVGFLALAASRNNKDCDAAALVDIAEAMADTQAAA